MKSTPNYITPKGIEKLRFEFHQLIHHERPQLVETIAWAAGNGDRSENADYIYGKRRLREIDRKLKILTEKIENALVVDPSTIQSDKILFGATVLLLNELNEEKKLQIVGEDEINPKEGLISWKSPIAKAMLNKKAGDSFLLTLPNKEMEYEILSVTYR